MPEYARVATLESDEEAVSVEVYEVALELQAPSTPSDSRPRTPTQRSSTCPP